MRTNDLGKFRLRASGPILDRDATAHDGIYAEAGGRAKCSERLITGGSQASEGEAATPFMRIVDSGPVQAERSWQVRWASDMGGAAGEDFGVIALCLVR